MTQVCEVFAVLAELCRKLEAAPANKHPDCWEVQIDDTWWVAFNGHDEPRRCGTGEMVKPFTCYVTFNGWPAGVFTPFGGVIAAGECANELAFINAVHRRIARVGVAV